MSPTCPSTGEELDLLPRTTKEHSQRKPSRSKACSLWPEDQEKEVKQTNSWGALSPSPQLGPLRQSDSLRGSPGLPQFSCKAGPQQCSDLPAAAQGQSPRCPRPRLLSWGPRALSYLSATETEKSPDRSDPTPQPSHWWAVSSTCKGGGSEVLGYPRPHSTTRRQSKCLPAFQPAV